MTGGWTFFFRYAGKKQTNDELRGMIDDKKKLANRQFWVFRCDIEVGNFWGKVVDC